jgi:TPR repeat protein
VKGVEQSYKETFNWFKKAAQQGDAKAQNILGLMYANGEGVEQNHKEALNWLKKSAEQGNADAKTLLTKLLESK